MTLEEEIADKFIKLHKEDIDANILNVLKRNIMDSYAGICGSMYDQAMLSNFEKLASSNISGSDINIWGIMKQGSLSDAIFVNTILARRSDLLSTYISPNKMGGVHPSDNVALALILADWLKMDGLELIKTIRTMFYISASFADYYNPEVANYDHDAAATFITSLGIGCVLGLSIDELSRAQRIAGMFGLDTNKAAVGEITDWKHCTYASCAYRGFMSVKLAKAGFQAPSEIYDGQLGINNYFPHQANYFEQRPDLTKIIFKRWPALVFCQTPIDVALEITKKIPNKEEIELITVKTYDTAYRNGATSTSKQPTTRAGRTHSIAYCVATSLLKPIEYSDFDQKRASDPKLKDLINKINVVNDTELTNETPKKSPCTIIIQLKNGKTITAHRDCPKGDPIEPLSDQDIEEKFKTYFFFAKNNSEKNELIDRFWSLDKQKTLDWLLTPLKRKLI